MFHDARHTFIVHVVDAVDLHVQDDGLAGVLFKEILYPCQHSIERQVVIIVVLGKVGSGHLLLAMQHVQVFPVVMFVRRVPGFAIIGIQTNVEGANAIFELFVDETRLAFCEFRAVIRDDLRKN